MTLAWADGRSADMPELQQFICSEPVPRSVHRRMARTYGAFWEREVQSGLRAQRLPVAPSELLLIGRDAEGIAAVSWACEIGGPDEFKLLAGAVALRCRRKGLGYGDDLVEEMLGRLVERVSLAGEPRAFVWGLVHVRNVDSQKLMERQGFAYLDEVDELQRWGILVEPPPTEI